MLLRFSFQLVIKLNYLVACTRKKHLHFKHDFSGIVTCKTIGRKNLEHWNKFWLEKWLNTPLIIKTKIVKLHFRCEIHSPLFALYTRLGAHATRTTNTQCLLTTGLTIRCRQIIDLNILYHAISRMHYELRTARLHRCIRSYKLCTHYIDDTYELSIIL